MGEGRTPATALALVLAGTLSACAGGGGARGPAGLTVTADSLPLALDAVADSTLWSVPGEEIAGTSLLSLVDGDFRLPALSPDGERVAFVEVVRSDTAVRSRVRLRRLDADSGRILLGWDEVDAYGVAVYSPWVHSLRWRGADTLVAGISDGDVGTTTVALALPSGKVLSESYEQGDPSGDLGPAEAALRNRIVDAFPGWRPEVVASALRMGQVLETDDGVLLQKRYAGEDAHVRWLEWATGDTTRVLSMPRALERRGELRPGVAVGERLLFPLVEDERVHLFEFRADRRLAWWGSVPTATSHYHRLRPVDRSDDGTLVQLDVGSDECCVHEPVLWVTGDRLVEWTDDRPVADVDARLDHGLVAWTRWTKPDSTRALRVHRLER